MEIHATLHTGNTIALDVAASDTVYSVKIQIRTKTGIPARHQGLVFKGVRMENAKKLKKYSIIKGSTVEEAGIGKTTKQNK